MTHVHVQEERCYEDRNAGTKNYAPRAGRGADLFQVCLYHVVCVSFYLHECPPLNPVVLFVYVCAC